MSDVVVNVVESATNVTVTEQDVAVDVTETVVEVSAATAGIQGASYNQGDPIYVYVRNQTGSTMPKGTIVYAYGSSGTHTLVAPALATGDSTSARTLGWLAETLTNNQVGLCQIEGYIEGIDTDHLPEGSSLYLSGVTAGAFTNVKPQAPIHLVYVGILTKSNPGNGKIFIKVQNGYELDEIHDVKIDDPQNNQVLTYDSATDLWINATNPADGVTSITATAPLTGGTITSTGSIGLDQTALSITQSQVTNLITDLAAKANLAGGNAFTSAQTITASTATQVPLTLVGASGQTANLLSTAGGARIPAAGNYFIAPGLTSTFVADFNAGNATTTPVTIKAFGSQTASVLALQNSAGSITANFTAPVNNVNRLNLGGTDLSATFGITVHASGGVGQVIRAAASQTADLLKIQNSAATDLGYFSASGDLWVTGAVRSLFYTNKNNTGGYLNYSTNSPMFEQRITTEVGLRVRGASGQTADLLQVQDSAGTNYLSVNNVGSLLFGTGSGSFLSGANGRVNVQLSGDNVGLTVRAFTTQTADLLKIQNNAGVDLVRVDNAGRGIFPTVLAGALTGSIGVQMAVQPTAATTPGFAVRGAVNQLEDLTEYQNSSGTILGGRNAIGQSFIGSATPLQGQGTTAINTQTPTGTTDITITTGTNHGILVGQTVVIAGVTPTGYNGTWVAKAGTTGTTLVVTIGSNPGAITVAGTVTVNAALSITPSSTKNTALVIRQASGQAFNLMEIQNSSGLSQLTVTPTGGLLSYQANQFQTFAPAVIPVRIIGAASQTANLQEWLNSSSTILSRISSSGQFVSDQQTYIGSGATSIGNTRFNVATGAASVVGAVIRGAASQTANLTEWQNSAGSVIANIGNSGGLSALFMQTEFGLAQLANQNSGGGLRLNSVGASTNSNPGASRALIYVKDGTTPGTLKLVVRAGAAGAETTILDNIPQ